MKLIIGLLAAAGLCGCVAYPAGYGASGAYYSNGGGAYYGSAPVYIDGSVGYSRGYYRNDGRRYRDRDGDGVPNRYDAYPDDPRRR
jgi:hypothetical protein